MAVDVVLDRTNRVLVPVDPKAIGCHMAVLAQSGSGKSFLVGRLIEEVLLKTKARVVVLDPNSDFVRLPQIDETAWTRPYLQPWFPPGDTLGNFAPRWSAVTKTVLSNRNLPDCLPLRISWGGLTDTERATAMELNPALDAELYWSLVLAGELARERWDDGGEADYDFTHFRAVADELCDYLLGAEGPADIAGKALAATLRSSGPAVALKFRSLVYSLERFEIWRAVGDGERDIGDIVADPNASQATVIDLLSVDSEDERLALVTRALASIWKGARDAYSSALRAGGEPDQRVPTILVIDEAHNIVPAQRSSPAAERVAAEVVRIAAEGRKFGLYLLLVTQRPRKLDANLLSECDALFLMKMTNESDLKSSSELFGFLDNETAQHAKSLSVGESLLLGRLGGGATICHAAPRRTQQGGRSLDDNYWSVPHPGR